jgi:hypothetical protein
MQPHFLSQTGCCYTIRISIAGVKQEYRFHNSVLRCHLFMRSEFCGTTTFAVKDRLPRTMIDLGPD